MKNISFAMFLTRQTISSLGQFWRPCCLAIRILSPPRRPDTVPPMSIVALGDNLGSSVGSPEPPFGLVWSLLSSLSRMLNVSSDRSAVACCNFSIFRFSRSKKDCQNLGKAFVLLCFWLGTQSPACVCFGDHVSS